MNKKIKLLVYSCLQEELIKKFKVGGIIEHRWIIDMFLGRNHHIPKSLCRPVIKEMINLKIIKLNETYGSFQYEVLKPILDLEDTGSIYRGLGLF